MIYHPIRHYSRRKGLTFSRHRDSHTISVIDNHSPIHYHDSIIILDMSTRPNNDLISHPPGFYYRLQGRHRHRRRPQMTTQSSVAS